MIILDSNVVSELMRPALTKEVAAWFGAQGETPMLVTAITVSEIVYGLARLPAGGRRTALETAFASYVGPGGVLPVVNLDEVAARECGRFRALRESSGLRASPSDMMIAGIAATLGAKLATRNVRDFEGLPIQVLNPWATR